MGTMTPIRTPIATSKKASAGFALVVVANQNITSGTATTLTAYQPR